MKNLKVYRRSAIILTILSVAACSHAPSASDIPPGANFTAKILTDDTKLFTYSQRGARGGPIGGDEGGMGDGPSGGRGGFGGSNRGAQSAQNALRGAQAMVAQNHYCRDGFVVLEQYDEHGSYIVRGECRDAATSADREKFAH